LSVRRALRVRRSQAAAEEEGEGRRGAECVHFNVPPPPLTTTPVSPLKKRGKKRGGEGKRKSCLNLDASGLRPLRRRPPAPLRGPATAMQRLRWDERKRERKGEKKKKKKKKGRRASASETWHGIAYRLRRRSGRHIAPVSGEGRRGEEGKGEKHSETAIGVDYVLSLPSSTTVLARSCGRARAARKSRGGRGGKGGEERKRYDDCTVWSDEGQSAPSSAALA